MHVEVIRSQYLSEAGQSRSILRRALKFPKPDLRDWNTVVLIGGTYHLDGGFRFGRTLVTRLFQAALNDTIEAPTLTMCFYMGFVKVMG